MENRIWHRHEDVLTQRLQQIEHEYERPDMECTADPLILQRQTRSHNHRIRHSRPVLIDLLQRQLAGFERILGELAQQISDAVIEIQVQSGP